MKVIIQKRDYEMMTAHAKQMLPEEACGLIAGIDREDGIREIRKVYLLENTDHTNEYFSISPADQLKAIKDMRKEGLLALGNWHSHPETPARPSKEDIRLANDPAASYLILSLADMKHPDLRSFHIAAVETTKTVSREELQIQ